MLNSHINLSMEQNYLARFPLDEFRNTSSKTYQSAMMFSQFKTATVFVLLGVSVLSSCQTNSRRNSASAPAVQIAPDLPSQDYIYGTANVESVEANVVNDSGPTKLRLRIRGLLNDGATNIDQIQHTRVPEGFVVTVTTARLKSAVATLALVPFEREITIDLSSFPSGPCQVRVNEVRTTVNVP